MKKASNSRKMAIGLGGVLFASIVGCVSFNRDALWNAAIDDETYCTYWKGDFPVGSRFVHRADDWTEKRLDKGYELTIRGIMGNVAILEHGWQVFGESDPSSTGRPAPGRRMKIRKIAVQVLDASNLKVGEMFKEYGQYKYERDIIVDGKMVPFLVQENTCQDLVAEPYGFIHSW